MSPILLNNKHNIENIAVIGMENWGVAQCITDSEEHAEVMNLTYTLWNSV